VGQVDLLVCLFGSSDGADFRAETFNTFTSGSKKNLRKKFEKKLRKTW